MQKWWQKWWQKYGKLVLGVSAIAFILTPIAISYYVRCVTNSYLYTAPEEVPKQRVAIVFGAGIWADGTPTPMLADRVEAAVNLYRLGRVEKILMTGDNSSVDHNEVVAMQRHAAARGVALSDITLDYAGFNTYDSCYRAKAIFGVTKAVLLTQNFHIVRAVYTCRHLGIDAIGLGTPDWEVYSNNTMFHQSFREMFSTIKAIWEIHITRPLPKFLGQFEGIK